MGKWKSASFARTNTTPGSIFASGWSDFARDDLTREQAEMLADPARNCILVAADETDELVGFVEVSLRDWAEGCSTRPVGYIEAW